MTPKYCAILYLTMSSKYRTIVFCSQRAGAVTFFDGSQSAHRSAAGAARAPATLPPFRSGTASPTIVPVRGASVLTVVQTPQHVDLPLPLRALRRTYRRCAPAVRRRPSSRSHGASIFRCHCARSGGGTGPVPGTGARPALAPVPAPVTQPGPYEAHRSEGRRAQMVRVRKWCALTRGRRRMPRAPL